MIIGIDLGTTNSTLSYKIGSSPIEKFPISQLVSGDMEQELFFLPSFYYFPLPEEQKEPFVGFYAEQRGRELPERVIVSAKSWGSHPTQDKRAAFLPIGDHPEKRSPLEVLSAFLSHLKNMWEKKFPNDPFSKQSILITVPASFDPAARELIQEAASLSHYPDVTLMEEPLAAFYAWLFQNENNWREQLEVGDTVLVVDIGGGTTDFSLIVVEEKGGELSLTRSAVGDHLLLGGDNIDLALAYFAAAKLNQELDFIQFQSLVHRCREAKEHLLGEKEIDKWNIVLHGRGSKLIGGAQTVTLSKEEIEEVLIDGFFPPDVLLEEKPRESSTSSLTEMGLPFVKDPRVTAHLAHFLSKGGKLPNKVLFNGGTMKAARFQKRLLSVLEKWKGGKVTLLEGADLDFAVSKGAVYYGWTKQNKGIRIRAGTSKSYFIGIESAALAVPGIKPPVKAICIAPLGMEEGSEKTLENQKFSLLLEESARFRFFSSNLGNINVGEKASLQDVVELNPVEAVLDRQGLEDKVVAINLQSKVTELGMLEIWCVADSGKKWKLEFDVRH